MKRKQSKMLKKAEKRITRKDNLDMKHRFRKATGKHGSLCIKKAN